MPESLPTMLRLGKGVEDSLTGMDRQLIRMLESDPMLVVAWRD
jgi:hypothetical protein